MNIGDYVILAILAIWLGAVVWFIIRKKKQGGCVGCSCAGCAECIERRHSAERKPSTERNVPLKRKLSACNSKSGMLD